MPQRLHAGLDRGCPCPALVRGLLVLALSLPGAAQPIGLHQLLRLPLEQLLRLQISVPAPAPGSRP
jgi:hypothetical protein